MSSFLRETLFKRSEPRNEAQRRSSCFGEPSWKVGSGSTVQFPSNFFKLVNVRPMVLDNASPSKPPP